MPVVFYHMEGCGFCKKAKDELVDEIASGKVIVKDSNLKIRFLSHLQDSKT